MKIVSQWREQAGWVYDVCGFWAKKVPVFTPVFALGWKHNYGFYIRDFRVQTNLRCVMNCARYLLSTSAAISTFRPRVIARAQLALMQIMSFRTNRRRIGLILALGSMAWLSGPVLAQSSQPTVHAVGGVAPRPVTEERAKLTSHVSPDQKLRLVLGIQTPYPAQEEQFVRDLQDRSSPRFHHFLTEEEWNARFSPSAGDEQSVVDWAKSAGLTVTHRFPNRLLVDVEGSVATIEKAFNVTINRYALGARSFFANDRDPSIPAELGSVIHSVGGLNDYEEFKAANNFGRKPQFPMYSSGPVKLAGPSDRVDGDRTKLPAKAKRAGRGERGLLLDTDGYDPTDLYSSYAYDTNALYNLGHCCNPLGNAGVTPPETSIAIATVGSNDPNDFVGFHNQYPYLAYHYQIYFVDGTPTSPDGEGTLDFEWATAMSNSFGSAADTAMVYLYEGANNASSTWTDIFNQILSDGNARVFTNSHYCGETGCNDQGTMDTQHSIFNAMLGQGWTLIAISGDGGATADCATTSVGWPGNDPDMLTVGGTTLDLTFAGIRPIHETGWTGGSSAGSCSPSNDGGSGGGCSTKFAAPAYQQANPACGVNSRSVPDVALNSDWVHTPQNAYIGGQVVSTGGTSIAAPEMAGFFAQENAYLLYIGAGIGNNCYGSSPCAPLGQPNQAIYYEGFNAPYAAHYPFYDIQDGCNSNDVTAAGGLTYYCAGPGYDLVTGWGSVNMLHLAWLFNTWAAGDFGAPSVKFQGPVVNQWYNTDQGVFWLATDTSGDGAPANGVAGFTGLWDTDPGNIYSDPIPGCCDSYYQGPRVTTTDLGSTFVSAAGQGCHTVHVRAWDNAGLESDDSTYGPVCYDTVPPVTTAALAGPTASGVFTGAVKVTLTATDATSGVSRTAYRIDGGSWNTYTAPFAVTSTGTHTVSFYSTDNATNSETANSVGFSIKGKTSIALTSSLNPSVYGKPVKLTATVTAAYGGPATGSVTFKDGTITLGRGTLSGGKASLITSKLSAGTHSITAVFASTAHFLGSASPALSEKVSKANTSTALTSSPNPSTHTQPVTFTAQVTATPAGTPSGTVTFRDGTTVLGTGTISATTHQAKFTTSTLAVGTHSITAKYSGNANFNTSTSAVLKQIVK
jgi:hypothetical protein